MSGMIPPGPDHDREVARQLDEIVDRAEGGTGWREVPEHITTQTQTLGAVDYWWRQVGTDIEVRVRPDFLSSGPSWQHQYAPTGRLTIHLAPEPVDAERTDPLLEPIETPGPTIIRQAEWDDETQTWRSPPDVIHETEVFPIDRTAWGWRCRCGAAESTDLGHSAAETEAEKHRQANA